MKKVALIVYFLFLCFSVSSQCGNGLDKLKIFYSKKYSKNKQCFYKERTQFRKPNCHGERCYKKVSNFYKYNVIYGLDMSEIMIIKDSLKKKVAENDEFIEGRFLKLNESYSNGVLSIEIFSIDKGVFFEIMYDEKQEIGVISEYLFSRILFKKQKNMIFVR